MKSFTLTLGTILCLSACAKPASTIPVMTEAPVELEISAADGETLAATWWPADGEGPGLILLGVAGPNDRRLAFGDLAPFEALAEALSEAGIHVLAFDDRGVGGSGGDWTAVDFEAMGRDAAAAAQILARQPGVDENRIGFFGLSEGSGVALHAVADGYGDFVILGSPPGLPGEAALRTRLEAALDAQGASDVMRAEYMAAFETFAALSRAGDREGLEAFLSGPGAALVPAYGFIPPDPASQANLFVSPWHVAQLDYDPRLLMPQINVPVLILGGGLDPVLDPAMNHPPLVAGLPDAVAVVIPDANHLLIPAGTGSPVEYSTLTEDLHPEVPAEILDWMRSEGLLD